MLISWFSGCIKTYFQKNYKHEARSKKVEWCNTTSALELNRRKAALDCPQYISQPVKQALKYPGKTSTVTEKRIQG